MKFSPGLNNRILSVVGIILFLSMGLYSQDSFTLDFNPEVEGIVSRNLLQLFTYYDDFPNERATQVLLNQSDREGFCAGLGNSYGFYSFAVSDLSVTEENHILISPDRSYVNESVGGLMLGWYQFGSDPMTFSLEMEYDLVKDLVTDSSAFERMSGKTTLEWNIHDTLQIGISLWDVVSQFSLSASLQLLQLPGALSDREVALLNGAVVLLDTSLTTLLLDFSLTDSDYQYGSVDFVTPFTFLPFLFYDYFPNENHSYLTMTFSSLPFIGLDVFLSPRFSLHQGGLQSLETKLELLSLYELLTLGDRASRRNPSYRHRNEQGAYDNLSTMGIFHRRQLINRYTGQPGVKDYLGLQMSMFYSKDKAMDFLGIDLILEYDLDQNYTQYEVNLKYYF